MRTRDEHIDWCKQRAHEYLKNGDPKNALTLMFLDLGRHPETDCHPASAIGRILQMAGRLNSRDDVLRFIDCYC